MKIYCIVGVMMNSAFVLHTRPYRETSLLMDVLTEEQGRVTLVARSARGTRSRFRGILQAFTPLLIAWSGNGELVTLKLAEINGLPLNLRGVYLFSGLYLNELLMRVLQRFDPHEALFHLYQTTLQHLQSEQQTEITLRLFEKQLLIELGYALTLNTEANNGKLIHAEKFYSYDPHSGVVLVGNDYATMPNVFSGTSLLAIHENNFDDIQVLRDAKRLMRIALAPLLGEKPLKSRELFMKA